MCYCLDYPLTQILPENKTKRTCSFLKRIARTTFTTSYMKLLLLLIHLTLTTSYHYYIMSDTYYIIFVYDI